MTSIDVTNIVEVELLTYYLSATGIAGGNTSLRLFTNDVKAGLTPAQIKALTNAAFTEATFAGYAAKTLTAATWTITGGLPTAATYPLQRFERSSTGAQQTVRGWWLRRTSDSRLMAFRQFAGPLITEFNGHYIEFIPRIPLLDGNDG